MRLNCVILARACVVSNGVSSGGFFVSGLMLRSMANKPRECFIPKIRQNIEFGKDAPDAATCYSAESAVGHPK